MRSKSMLIGLLVFGLGLLMTIEPATVQAQLSGIGGIGPITNQPTSSECDSKNRDFGSGSTLVKTFSEVCAFDLGNNYGQGTGESDITFCPPGWNDLKHSIDITFDKSGFIQLCTAFKEQAVSGTPAVASCTGPHSINIAYLRAQGDHVYQVAESDPDDTRLVETDATLDLDM